MLTTEAPATLSTEQIIDLIACSNTAAHRAGYVALAEAGQHEEYDPRTIRDSLYVMPPMDLVSSPRGV